MRVVPVARERVTVRISFLAGLALAVAVLLAAPRTSSAFVFGVQTAAGTPVNNGAPMLSGTPAVGHTLTCAPGSWSANANSFSYSWLRDGVPIPGQSANTYTVQASDSGHSIACRVSALDTGGEYIISGLTSGSYKIEFYDGQEGQDFLPQFYNGKLTAGTADPLLLTAGTTVSGVNAALQVGGQVSGRVVAAGVHIPLAGVSVCAEPTAAGASVCAQTNSNGEYLIGGLASGSYIVEFSPESPYVFQYFNGKEQEGEANPVAVNVGTTTAGVNAELGLGARIAGTVTDSSSHLAIAHVSVCANGSTGHSCAETDASGKYLIEGLASGSYTIEFSPAFASGLNYLTQYYNDKAKSSEAEPIVVIAEETAGPVNAEMHPGAQIKGSVTDASTHSAIAGVSVCANPASAEASGGCASSNAAGEYVIAGLATGKYKVEFAPSSGNYQRQFYSEKQRESEAGEVSAVAGATVEGVNAKLVAGGQIMGAIADANTQAPVGEMLVCASKVGEAGVSGCGFSGANGEYVISGLPTGMYTVEFNDFICRLIGCGRVSYLSQYYNGVGSSAEATSVSVTAPLSTGSVNAEMRLGAAVSGRVTSAASGTALAGISVCAFPTTGFGGCTLTNGPGAAATATSAALAVAGSNFTMVKKPKFDAKSDDIDFFFTFATAGKLQWSLFFKNADVGFADSLGISLGSGTPVAEASRKGKAKRCKKGEVKHHGKCKRTMIPFASGSQSVPAGTVEVKVHAGSKAIKGLKAGHTLHVSGTFTFQSALGGSPVSHSESATVKLPPKKHHKGKGKR
jgi:Carboxypeptidase regulatory-like domain